MQRELDIWDTSLVPPIGEATVTDWIRHHMARVAMPTYLAQHGLTRDAVTCTSATSEELDAAVRGSMRLEFFRARRGLRTFLEVLDGSRDLDRVCDFSFSRIARLRMGHLRYGVCGANIEYDAIRSCISRVGEYERTGNQECLVDVANLCELEYWRPRIERTAWSPRCAVKQHASLYRVYEFLSDYTAHGCLTCLAHVVNLVEAECIAPTHPDAHWAPQDTGGHPSLREAAE